MSRDIGANSVSLLDLAADDWPIGTRTAWAEVAAGRRLDDALSLTPLSPAELQSRWQQVRQAK